MNPVNISDFRGENKSFVACVNVFMNKSGDNAEALAVKDAFRKALAGWHIDDMIPVISRESDGMARLMPVAEVMLPGEEKVTYVLLKPEAVPQIVEEHIVRGREVAAYTMNALEEAMRCSRAI